MKDLHLDSKYKTQVFDKLKAAIGTKKIEEPNKGNDINKDTLKDNI